MCRARGDVQGAVGRTPPVSSRRGRRRHRRADPTLRRLPPDPLGVRRRHRGPPRQPRRRDRHPPDERPPAASVRQATAHRRLAHSALVSGRDGARGTVRSGARAATVAAGASAPSTATPEAPATRGAAASRSERAPSATPTQARSAESLTIVSPDASYHRLARRCDRHGRPAQAARGRSVCAVQDGRGGGEGDQDHGDSRRPRYRRRGGDGHRTRDEAQQRHRHPAVRRRIPEDLRPARGDAPDGGQSVLGDRADEARVCRRCAGGRVGRSAQDAAADRSRPHP